MNKSRFAALVFLIFSTLPLSPAIASDDLVDAAMERGRKAAARGDWKSAVAAYEDARAVLPGRSASLSYNLGTAYAHLGELGWASLHLQRSMLREAAPTKELLEHAALNLGLVRQELEAQARAAQREFSPAEGGWELFVGFLSTPVIGWIALAAGWVGAVSMLALVWWRENMRAQLRVSLRIALWLGTAIWLFVGGAHALARTSDGLGTVIVVKQGAELRDGPGEHRGLVGTLAPGSQLSVIEKAIGWYEVRMSGGLQGWLSQSEVAWLRAKESEIGRGDK